MLENFSHSGSEILKDKDGYPMGAFRRRIPVESIPDEPKPEVVAEEMIEVGLGLEIAKTVEQVFRDSSRENRDSSWAESFLPNGYLSTKFKIEELDNLDLRNQLTEALVRGLEKDLDKRANINRARIEVIVESFLNRILDSGISENEANDLASSLKIKLEQSLNQLIVENTRRIKGLPLVA